MDGARTSVIARSENIMTHPTKSNTYWSSMIRRLRALEILRTPPELYLACLPAATSTLCETDVCDALANGTINVTAPSTILLLVLPREMNIGADHIIPTACFLRDKAPNYCSEKNNAKNTPRRLFLGKNGRKTTFYWSFLFVSK